MKISIKNLSYSYSGFNDERNALKDISLEISSNKRIAIVGHTGSGKSTLLKLIKGLLKNLWILEELILNFLKNHYIFQIAQKVLYDIDLFLHS